MKHTEVVNDQNKIIDIAIKISVVSLTLLFCCCAYSTTFSLDISVAKIFCIVVVMTALAFFLVNELKIKRKRSFIAVGIIAAIICLYFITGYDRIYRFFDNATEPIRNSFDWRYNVYIGVVNESVIKNAVNVPFLCLLSFTVFIFAVIFFLTAEYNKGFVIVILLVSAPVIVSGIVGVFPKTIICIGLIFSLMVFWICFKQWKGRIYPREFVEIFIVFLVIVICGYATRPYMERYRTQHSTEYNHVKQYLMNFDIETIGEVISEKAGRRNNGAKGVRFDGDLSNTKREAENNNVMLKVTLTELPKSTFYLKNYIGVKYTGDKWEELMFADFSGNITMFNEMSDKSVRKAIQNEMFRKIAEGGNAPKKQKATIEVLNPAGNRGYIPYFAEIPYYDSINIGESIEFGAGGSNSDTYQEYYYYAYLDANQMGASMLAAASSSWDDYEENIVNLVHKKLPQNLYALKQFASGFDKENINRVAEQIDDYFRGNLEYTLSPGMTPKDKDFAEYFLFENKKGFCVHFATAAALIYRECGFPSRYVEGYAIDPKQFQANDDGTYTAMVTGQMAHAWCETMDSNLGWIIREHTLPDEDNPVALQENVTARDDYETVGETESLSEDKDTQQQTTVKNEGTKTDILEKEKTAKLLTRENSSNRGRWDIWKIIGLFVLFCVMLLCVLKGGTYMHNMKCQRMRRKGNEGALFAYTSLYRIGLFLKRKYRGKSEQEIFYEMMNAYPKLSENEWKWMYEKAVEARFSNEQISREDVKRMFVLYKKFRRKILQEMDRKEKFVFLMNRL